jgi:hypothetical protein
MPESQRKIKLKGGCESFPFKLVKFNVRYIRSFKHVPWAGMAAQGSQAAARDSTILGLAYFATSFFIF